MTAAPSPARRRMDWVLENLTDGFRRVDAGEVADAFAPSFLAQVPAETFKATGEQLAASVVAGFTVEAVQEAPQGLVAVLAMPSGDRARVVLSADPAPPHRIAGLVVQPAPDLRPEPVAKSWKEVDARLQGLASRASVYAAELTSDVHEVHAMHADDRLALGSAFKLYVLGALAAEVEAGRASWDEPLAIRTAHKSLPSGDMRDLRAGAAHPVRHFAEQMISVSDNTATDHLLHRVGRETVERFQAQMGHGAPEANMPFLATREMFQLKWGLPSQHYESYLAGDEDGRRTVLASIARSKLARVEDVVAAMGAPKGIDAVEWFASGRELARAMLWLRDAMARPALAPLERVLSINPGAAFDRYSWAWVGFKGGSEPGVLNLTWLLRRFDERWFVLTIGLNDASRQIPPMDAVAVAIAAAALLVAQRKRPKRR